MKNFEWSLETKYYIIYIAVGMLAEANGLQYYMWVNKAIHTPTQTMDYFAACGILLFEYKHE